MKKLLSLVCVFAMLLTTAGCGASEKKFTATGKGYGGDMTVTITVKDDKITKVDIVGDKETQGIGSNAVEQMPEKIVAANSYDVDVVSGATITSTAIKKLTKEAMTEAYAMTGWDVTPKELKAITEFQYFYGANKLCQHLLLMYQLN